MDTYPEVVFSKYRTRGIIIDTNLFLLIAIGTYDMHRVLTFKRTAQYTLDDLLLMKRIVGFFERRFTTPNILTEVDNLMRQLPQHEHEAVSITLSQLVSGTFEVYVPSLEMIQYQQYCDLGLTDCVTMAASTDALVVTDDFRLSNTLSSLGRDAVNINHIRDIAHFL